MPKTFKDLEDVRLAAMGNRPVPQPAGKQIADLYEARNNTSVPITLDVALHMIAHLWDALQHAEAGK